MIKYNLLGFENFEKFQTYFFNTLLSSNKTYEYFVNWNKVKNAVMKYVNELSLLNSLTKIEPSRRKKHLYDLLIKYPQIIEVIPLLIAERVKNKKIDIFDPILEKFITFEFKPSKIKPDSISKIVQFCAKTGIIDLFGEIKDVHDYLLGIEVGLDTNARKNRSGEIFEKMCQNKIKKFLTSNYIPANNDPKFILYPIINKEKGRGKTHDIVIYKNKKPIAIVECNFYNVSGSKPVSISESYIEMYKVAKKHEINFVWVTDGPAWLKMKEPLIRAMKEIEFILNFKMLNLIKKILR